MNTPSVVRCSYAACDLPGECWEPVPGWWFCPGHFSEHLALIAQPRSCNICTVEFVATDPRRTRCDKCRGVA